MSAPSSDLGSARLGSITPQPSGPSPGADRFATLASAEVVARTVSALEANGIHAVVVPDRAAARAAILSLIPEGSTVLPVSSQTVAATGVLDDLSDAHRFHNLRPGLMRFMQEGKAAEARKFAAAPDVVLGSVHALTESGQSVIASASGSQLGPYASGAGKVVWVVGTQKIVPDLETAIRRLQEYSFPREDARALQAYGRGSVIAKLLIVGKEFVPGRVTMILVQENLGF